MIDSGLFVGTLRHRRFTPVAHAFTYPLFMALLDIDRVPELMRVSRLTSHNRWNWASFDDRDHLGDPARPLRERLAVDAARHGVDSAGRSDLPADAPAVSRLRLQPGVVLLLLRSRASGCSSCSPRCSNTFGGAHNYWLRPDPASRTFRAAAAKSLYVSPFMPVDLEYAFAFTPPGDRLVAHMEDGQGGSVCFDATLSLERRPWSAAEIRRALFRHPGDDRERDGGHSLAGAEVVVEGRARRASRHARRRGRACGVG